MTGTTLAELLRRPARTSHTISLSILRQTAAILDEAHRRGQLHPALSPASIVVVPVSGERMLRVGMPDLYGAPQPSLSTLAGRQPPPEHAKYMSREEILGMTRDGRSDVFSLAVIAYELLTGRKPFDAPDLPGLCYAICVEGPQLADTVAPEIGTEAARVLDRAMAKEAGARYRTCSEFTDALTAAIARQPEASAVPAAVQVPFEESVAVAYSVAVGTTANEAPRFTSAAVETPWLSGKPPATEQGQPAFPESTVAFPPLPVRSRARREPEAEPEPLIPRSSLQRVGLLVAVALLLLGGIAWVFNGRPQSSLPVQVLDTKSGPATPPPTSAPSTSAPSTSAPPPNETTETAALKPAPAPAPATHEPALRNPAINPAPTQAQPTPARMDGGAFVEMLTEPPGARVMIDSRPDATCVTPCSLELPAGRHVLTAQLNGFATTNRIFHVPDERSLVIAMPPSVGTVLVTSNPPGATILLDGREAGHAPLTLHLKAGQHRLDAMYGAFAQQKMLDVQADDIQGASFDLH